MPRSRRRTEPPPAPASKPTGDYLRDQAAEAVAAMYAVDADPATRAVHAGELLRAFTAAHGHAPAALEALHAEHHRHHEATGRYVTGSAWVAATHPPTD